MTKVIKHRSYFQQLWSRVIFTKRNSPTAVTPSSGFTIGIVVSYKRSSLAIVADWWFNVRVSFKVVYNN